MFFDISENGFVFKNIVHVFLLGMQNTDQSHVINRVFCKIRAISGVRPYLLPWVIVHEYKITVEKRFFISSMGLGTNVTSCDGESSLFNEEIMNNSAMIRLLMAILAYIHLAGCQGQMVKSDNRQVESVLTASQEEAGPDRNHDQVREISTDTTESAFVDYQPASVEQLQAALTGLESFRVFGYHFKMQNDQTMLGSLREPTFEYIANHIDPHLKLQKIKYDPTSEIYIASFLYMKAYLFWIHNETDSARKTIAVLNRTFPQRHPDITIHHFDRGKISLDDALDDFEGLIGPDTNKKQ
ncbi:MAG: hypothetical protein C4522_09850 [Desulfobacteraceae bacterium]|nr:MAG: hypothetical protein C4522_09850 [Desulfobacteraceae bacterium]